MFFIIKFSFNLHHFTKISVTEDVSCMNSSNTDSWKGTLILNVLCLYLSIEVTSTLLSGFELFLNIAGKPFLFNSRNDFCIIIC